MAWNAKGRGTSGVAPEAKAGTRLRRRCLDGCYGNRRHSEALCISHTDRGQWSNNNKGIIMGNKGGWKGRNTQLCSTQTAKWTR